MSEQENIESVRRLYQLMNDGDLPGVLSMLADDVELFVFGSAKVPWAGHWQGRDGGR
jgi:ketosteroid isomerase-like protein